MVMIEENNRHIAFLDTLVLQQGNALTIDVYQKPMQTNHLDYMSHHDERQN